MAQFEQSEGALRLRRYLHRKYLTQAQFAEAIPVTPATVNRWLSGALLPSEAAARCIELCTGIRAGLWRRPARVVA